MWLISMGFVLGPVLPADSQEHDGVLEQRPAAASLVQGAEPQRGERLGQRGQMSGGECSDLTGQGLLFTAAVRSFSSCLSA